jgi:hypothetical protein
MVPTTTSGTLGGMINVARGGPNFLGAPLA